MKVSLVLILILAVTGGAAAQEDLELSAAGAKKHRKAQKLPIDLGTSGGNANDFDPDVNINLPCISGTLGALVQGEAQYILSTNLTLAMRNNAKAGDPVIQPGLIDTSGGACNPDNPKGNPVADLTKFKKIKYHKANRAPKNKVDAALAEVRDGSVDPNGRILGIGIPGSQVVAPFLGQQVQKSGRGTGVKTATVVAVNFTADVDYGFPAGTGPLARMIKQFVVQSNDGKAIYANGDSGSVFFQNTPACPGWVGLGIAVNLADATIALATPISMVLQQLGKVKPKGSVEPVGCKSAPVSTAGTLSLRAQRAIRDAEHIQRRVERDVLRLPGVVGIGIGMAADNAEEVVFKVLVDSDSASVRAGIPGRLGKVRSEILKVGRFGAAG